MSDPSKHPTARASSPRRTVGAIASAVVAALALSVAAPASATVARPAATSQLTATASAIAPPAVVQPPADAPIAAPKQSDSDEPVVVLRRMPQTAPAAIAKANAQNDPPVDVPVEATLTVHLKKSPTRHYTTKKHPKPKIKITNTGPIASGWLFDQWGHKEDSFVSLDPLEDDTLYGYTLKSGQKHREYSINVWVVGHREDSVVYQLYLFYPPKKKKKKTSTSVTSASTSSPTSTAIPPLVYQP